MNVELIKLSKLLLAKSLVISTAESCTGGSLSALLTSLSGASCYFDRGYVTYSNQAKINMLGVNKATLDNFGAVSEQTIKEMLLGIIKNCSSDIAVAISGIAGPGGGTKKKPVGLVWFGFYLQGSYVLIKKQFNGGRGSIITQSTDFVLVTLNAKLSLKD